MMQTVLTQTPSTPASGLDKAPQGGFVEGSGIEGGTSADSKGDFATLIAKAQSREQGAAEANQGGHQVQTAKSLATESSSAKEETRKEQDPEADNKVEEIPATDFLLRLQDSLKLDTSLVTPQLAVVAPPSLSTADGNPLPPEGEQGAIVLDDSEQASATARSARHFAGQAEVPSPLVTTAKPVLDPGLSSSAQRLVAQGELPSSVLSPEGEDDASVPEGEPGQNIAAKGEASGADGKQTRPLTGAERMAQLAKVLPVDESAHLAKTVVAPDAQEGADSKVESVANNAVNGKGQTAQTATQGAALKAFNEGLKQPDAGGAGTASTTEGSGVAGKGAEKSAAEGGAQTATTSTAHQGSTHVTPAHAAAAQGSGTPVVSPQSDNAAVPVMVVPEQVLAQAESQGPQAPLASISAGIKQMEVTGSEAVRKAVQPEVKVKASETEKSLLATTSSDESNPSQTAASGQNGQLQPQQVDSRAPVAEGTLRREPQNLPHLKLASQEAPAELHQKVNVMLAEKLQQAEIQLDPLGLGKMKIQIQLDSSSQANVHFVVQHGQTREMLEQAMPRLREMLAGQGIQLGQTQVQHQSQQQQQQGQPAFSGQGQQGQGGSQNHAGNGHGAGDITTTSLNLLVESTNGSGIDFYA